MLEAYCGSLAMYIRFRGLGVLGLGDPKPKMSYSLNSLKGVIWGITMGFIKGDTRSLDYSSYKI